MKIIVSALLIHFILILGIALLLDEPRPIVWKQLTIGLQLAALAIWFYGVFRILKFFQRN